MFNEYCKVNKNPKTGKKLKTSDVAEILGFDYDHFRKIVNMNRPTKNRDLIIAICIILGLDCDETDKMLKAYDMPILNGNDDGREDLIYGAICESKSLEHTNNILVRAGYNGLQIPHSEHRHFINKQKKSNFIPIKKRVKWLTVYDTYFRSPYNSLISNYQPDQYQIIAEMIVENRETHNRLRLSSSATKHFTLYFQDENGLHIEHDENITESHELFYFFEELHLLAGRELDNKLSYLNDSKNYHDGRWGAKMAGTELYIYTEEYNYDVPELNEYYLMEYKNNQYILSVFQKSVFLQKHLSPETYNRYFKVKPTDPKEVYESLDDLKVDQRRTYSEKEMISLRARAYRRLKAKLTDALSDLKNKKVFIRNLEYIYDNPADVLKYYNLTDAFQCQYDEEYGEIANCLESIEWTTKDEKRIELTFKDICSGFELGVDNIDDICNIKLKYGGTDITRIIPG